MPREKTKHRIEVHVSTVCLRTRDGVCEVLLGKRAAHREIYPSLWECGGGQVHEGLSFEQAVSTQLREEFGIEADVLFPFDSYLIAFNDARPSIPGIRFICTPVEPNPPLILDPQEIVEAAWVPVKDLSRFSLIPQLDKALLKAEALFTTPAQETAP